MRPRPHLLGNLSAAAIIAAAIVLNQATGGRVFTSFPNADLARMKSYESAADEVFHDPGLDADRPPSPAIDNAFHFGWLPSGFSRQALSVLTMSLLAGGVAILNALRPGRPGPSEAPEEFQTPD